MEVPLQGHVTNLPEKVVAYEKFLDTVLRPALKDSEERRNEVNQELRDYRDLEDNIASLLQSAQPSLRTLVDLGGDSGVYCQAEVPDASRVYINIGLGFHVECTLEEAAHPIRLRKEALEKKAEKLANETSTVKADIKFVTEGIREILNLPPEAQEGRVRR